MSNSNNAVQFCRVSSDGQRDGFSLEAQQRLGEEYAKKNRLVIKKVWTVSESASNEDNRKYFFEMRNYVLKHNVRHIIWDKTDRAVRGFKSAVIVEELVAEENVKCHFVRENLTIDKDSSSSEKMRFYLQIVLSKYYIDNLKTEIRKGSQARLEEGYWNGKAPFGYINTRSEHKKAEVRLDPAAAEVVREIFDKYATGNFSFKTLAELASNKLGRNCTKRLVEELISNPFYFGEVVSRGRSYGIGRHEPLISKELWTDCQRIRGIKALKVKTRQDPFKITKAYMRLLKCGHCGRAITGEGKVRKGRTYIYYHCANPACEKRRYNIPEHIITQHLIQAFEPFTKFTAGGLNKLIETLSKKLVDIDLESQKRSGQLAERRQELAKSIEQAEKLFQSGVIKELEFIEIKRLREQAFEDFELECESACLKNKSSFERGKRVIETINLAYDSMKLAPNNSQRADLAKLVLSKLFWKNGKLEYHYKKPFDLLVEIDPGPGWWSKRENVTRIVDHFSNEVKEFLPAILAA